MKLCRIGAAGHEKPGLQLPDGTRVDASALGEDYDETFFGTGGLGRLAAWQKDHAARAPRFSASERVGPPICRPSKIVCIGLNYRDHARESGANLPKEPIVFLKATSAFSGPADPVLLPVGGEKTDWEVELAVVIEKAARYVTTEQAMDFVAGFALHNDYSERGFQLERNGQWTKGKSADTFAPVGPLLCTRDELPNFDRVNLWLKVNGEQKQNGNTSDMLFDVPYLVSYVSQFMTLLPGDVISTGTPAGVGLGHKPPVYLKAGDVIEYGIEGLGETRQVVVAPA